MKNVFGNAITYTLFGESHGPCVGIVIDGLPSGLKVDEAYMAKEMAKRRSISSISTPRREEDQIEIWSGVKDGFTEGTPVTLVIRNNNTRSSDYSLLEEIARPSHAEYTAEMKYQGYQDVRGGGHFSGRLTAPIVAAGALVRKALEEKGIFIGTHISRCGAIEDASFAEEELLSQITELNEKDFAVLSEEAGKEMIEKIQEAREENDSVGGILESVIVGLEAGLGEPVFDSFESLLAHGLFSIPAVKGVEFGSGFALADKKGSEANDPLRIKDGKAVTVTNHNGGINGGITNGMPVVFRTVIKPTASIAREQNTINYKTMENATLTIQGRHDPAIVHRARAVVDAISAMVVAEFLVQRYGYQSLRGEK